MSEAMCVQLVVARDALRGHGIRAPAARWHKRDCPRALL